MWLRLARLRVDPCGARRQALRAPESCLEDGVGITYKVVELSSVTDEEIEKVLNEVTAEGWTLDTMQFAMRDSSKRPSMAFISFTKTTDD